MAQPVHLAFGDAQLIIDIQNDFLPGGSLAVPDSGQIIPAINAYIAKFRQRGMPVYASRDWHPPDHGSFVSQGGPWPAYCVAGSRGAAFPAALILPETAHVISKGVDKAIDGYSAWQPVCTHNWKMPASNVYSSALNFLKPLKYKELSSLLASL